MTPVLYLLDVDGEAYDVLWFCSPGCRDMHSAPDMVKSGYSAEYIAGTVCDECGKEISA